METVEMPAIEELDETSQWPVPPRRIEEQEMDVAAFHLWEEASRPEPARDESE